jgi:hypothetical protein
MNVYFAWRFWRLSTGKACIKKCVVQKRTPSYTWAVPNELVNTKLSNENKFDKNGRGKYSQEPCCERLFFTEKGAFHYATKLNQDRTPYR